MKSGILILDFPFPISFELLFSLGNPVLRNLSYFIIQLIEVDRVGRLRLFRFLILNQQVHLWSLSLFQDLILGSLFALGGSL